MKTPCTEHKCVSDGSLYLSNPPQCKCKNCGQLWFTGDSAPNCRLRDIPPTAHRTGDLGRVGLVKEKEEFIKKYAHGYIDEFISDVENLINHSVFPRIEHLEKIQKKIKEMKWEIDEVCTHYQDNCSCRSDIKVIEHNKLLDKVLKLFK